MASMLEVIPYDISKVINICQNLIDYNDFNDFNDYYGLVVITVITVITVMFGYLANEIINYYNKQIHTEVISKPINNTDKCSNIGIGVCIKEQPKELYYQSVLEVLSKNEDIASNMVYNTDYWILIRVVLKHPMSMRRTKYELHGNNVGNIGNRMFKTNDMYMVIKLKFYDYQFMNCKIKFNMANIIVRCMNHLNKISPEEYKTRDFIVVAISTKPINIDNGNINDCNIENSNKVFGVNNRNEFYNGLINNNYELYNFREMIFKIDSNTNSNTDNKLVDNNLYIGYIIMLPIHEIYDIFMDVYNTTLFESVKYVINDNNYESWNGVSINELKF
jgi:hypothetical protein